MKKIFALLAAVLLFSLSGCGPASSPEGNDTLEQVSVALWSDQLTEGYAQYLEETFPEVDFTFYVATNSTDFYRFKQEQGDLPDILTVRRFALNDVSAWKDSLLDLSGTELASTFYPGYLRSYTYSDGTVNWLPACAEVDGILLNRALLDSLDVPVPTDYESFVDACAALTEAGVRPFRSNFGADYTCMELLQGLSITQLTSQAGREWRQQYESGQTNRLSEEVWLPVFERMEEFIGYAGITPADLEGDAGDMFSAYMSGEAAMIRATSGETTRYGAEVGSSMMPYFGDTENWYLTYPAFQAAASARAKESPEREKLILRILDAMLNQEGLRHIATGENMIAYNKDIELRLSPLLSEMPDYVESNRLYIRLASADMFACSKQVVQGMITGEYPDARSAFDAFNSLMAADTDSAVSNVRIDTGYSYAFDPDGGSPAASAVMNSLREELGAQLLVGQSVNVAGNISAGDYTVDELRFLTMGEAVDILRCQVTGEQLRGYLEAVLSAEHKRGCVAGNSTLYVSSGFEMELRKTEEGYLLERLTVEGAELDMDKVYDLAVLGNERMLQRDALASAGVTEYQKEERAFKQIIADRLVDGRQLAQPTDYITLR